MRDYQYILFDLDGTISDPAEGITNSVMYALDKFGIQVTDRRELFRFIGPPLQDSFVEYYGFGEKEAQKAVEYYREYFSDRGLFENVIYEDTKEMLELLVQHKKEIILATSKPECFARKILDHFGLTNYFTIIAGASMDGARVKKADVIEYALEKNSRIEKTRAVMIGDREHDIIGAKAVGIDSIGVLYGYGGRAELENAGADFIAPSIKDIEDIILRNV